MLTKSGVPTARGPLLDWHRQAGGRIENVDGWDVCVSYPAHDFASEDVLVDWSHRRVREINGPGTAELVRQVCGEDLAVRRMTAANRFQLCRLTTGRAVDPAFKPEPGDPPEVCHSFITDGRIQFLNDCTHALAGHTVPLPPFSWGEE